MYPIDLGRLGFCSSQVSVIVWVRKSIQRRSATERTRAERREAEVMFIVLSSSYVQKISFMIAVREIILAYIDKYITVSVSLLQEKGVC